MTKHPSVEDESNAQLETERRAAIAEWREARNSNDPAKIKAAEVGIKAAIHSPNAQQDVADRLIAAINDLDEKPLDPNKVKDFEKALKEKLDFPSPPDPIKARKVPAIPKSELPKAILQANGKTGAILGESAVCLLAGEGGIAKSALTVAIAHDMALPELDNDVSLCGGLFKTETGRGPVLMVCYEDPAANPAWKLKELAHKRPGTKDLNRIEIIDLQEAPLYGNEGSYNAMAKPLQPGWDSMIAAIDRIKPRLVVIDPATAAFVGNQNDAGAVRRFLGALSKVARDYKLGILLVAHSNKAARGTDRDVFDPGQIAGSTHWTDGARGAMVLDWKPKGKEWGGKPGDRILAIAKANWGPMKIWIDLEAIRHSSDAIVGLIGKPGAKWANKPGREVQEPEDGEGQATPGRKKKVPLSRSRDRGRNTEAAQ